MTKYVDNLKQIIEAMNFSHDVENFMEALGPFYEEVEEKEMNNQSNVVYQSTARHAQDNDIISSIVEESSMQQMIPVICQHAYDVKHDQLMSLTIS